VCRTLNASRRAALPPAACASAAAASAHASRASVWRIHGKTAARTAPSGTHTPHCLRVWQPPLARERPGLHTLAFDAAAGLHHRRMCISLLAADAKHAALLMAPRMDTTAGTVRQRMAEAVPTRAEASEIGRRASRIVRSRSSSRQRCFEMAASSTAFSKLLQGQSNCSRAASPVENCAFEPAAV